MHIEEVKKLHSDNCRYVMRSAINVWTIPRSSQTIHPVVLRISVWTQKGTSKHYETLIFNGKFNESVQWWISWLPFLHVQHLFGTYPLQSYGKDAPILPIYWLAFIILCLTLSPQIIYSYSWKQVKVQVPHLFVMRFLQQGKQPTIYLFRHEHTVFTEAHRKAIRKPEK